MKAKNIDILIEYQETVGDAALIFSRDLFPGTPQVLYLFCIGDTLSAKVFPGAIRHILKIF